MSRWGVCSAVLCYWGNWIPTITLQCHWLDNTIGAFIYSNLKCEIFKLKVYINSHTRHQKNNILWLESMTQHENICRVFVFLVLNESVVDNKPTTHTLSPNSLCVVCCTCILYVVFHICQNLFWFLVRTKEDKSTNTNPHYPRLQP